MSEYFDIVKNIDIDEFENAIGFEPMDTNTRGEDYGHCPDPWNLHKHGDRTGKFAINRDKKVYNCFVCGGGNLLSLTMAIRDCDERDAIEWLRQFTSKSNQTDESFIDEINRLLIDKKTTEQETLPWFNDNVLTQWVNQNNLWFAKRGISDEIVSRYRLGVNYKTKRINQDQEFISESIVLPHFWNGRLVGWQNRWLGDRPKWVPKYTNTNDFPKRTTLFGWDHVLDADSPIVIVESVPTVLYLASLGIPAVATFGATVSKEQMKMLRGCQQGIVLAQDNDQAGDKWRGDLISYLDRYIPVMEMEIAWEDDIGETRMVQNSEVTIGLYNNPIYV
jgi:DNA primase